MSWTLPKTWRSDLSLEEIAELDRELNREREERIFGAWLTRLRWESTRDAGAGGEVVTAEMMNANLLENLR